MKIIENTIAKTSSKDYGVMKFKASYLKPVNQSKMYGEIWRVFIMVGGTKFLFYMRNIHLSDEA